MAAPPRPRKEGEILMLLKVSQAAKRLNVSAAKIYVLVKAGEIPHHRIGGAIRFSEEDIADFLEATKRERGNAPAKRQPPRPHLKHIRL